jgi:hypothetical protein
MAFPLLPASVSYILIEGNPVDVPAARISIAVVLFPCALKIIVFMNESSPELTSTVALFITDELPILKTELSKNLKFSTFEELVIVSGDVELVAPLPFIFTLLFGELGAPIFSRTFESSHAKLAEAANEPAGVELN